MRPQPAARVGRGPLLPRFAAILYEDRECTIPKSCHPAPAMAKIRNDGAHCCHRPDEIQEGSFKLFFFHMVTDTLHGETKQSRGSPIPSLITVWSVTIYIYVITASTKQHLNSNMLMTHLYWPLSSICICWFWINVEANLDRPQFVMLSVLCSQSSCSLLLTNFLFCVCSLMHWSKAMTRKKSLLHLYNKKKVWGIFLTSFAWLCRGALIHVLHRY